MANYDPTEYLRRQEVREINANPTERNALEAAYGQVWSTDELTAEFSVEGFLAPYVVVTRKADGVKGSLRFQHRPRYYFSFTPYTKG